MSSPILIILSLYLIGVLCVFVKLWKRDYYTNKSLLWRIVIIPAISILYPFLPVYTLELFTSGKLNFNRTEIEFIHTFWSISLHFPWKWSELRQDSRTLEDQDMALSPISYFGWNVNRGFTLVKNDPYTELWYQRGWYFYPFAFRKRVLIGKQ